MFSTLNSFSFAFVKFEDFRFLGLYTHTCIYVYVYADFKFWYKFLIRINCLKYLYLLSVLIRNRSIIKKKKGFLQLSFIENVRLNRGAFEETSSERHYSSTIFEYLRLRRCLEKSRLHIFSLRRLHQRRSLSGAILSPSRRRMQGDTREDTSRTRNHSVWINRPYRATVCRSIFSMRKINMYLF